MRFFLFIFYSSLLLFIPVHNGYTQIKKDTVEKKTSVKKVLNQGMRLISTTPKDTVVSQKSADPYAQYKGKIIRTIYIERVGFEKSIYDSAKKVEKSVTKLANTLHVDTRPKIIRKHLFIKENQPLNPYKLADNERFLRDKDFILDSRIQVIPIENSDSVDLKVVTRDVFSFGGTLGGNIPSAPRIGIYDANVNGRGQRIELTTLIDPERDPTFGYSLLYRKSSIFGSLTNLELVFTQINRGLSFGDENEYASIMRLERPLVSPYSRLAGGLELSRNWSMNVEQKPNSEFLSYHYNIVDAWLGYNLGVNRAMTDRNRLFFAVRSFDGTYLEQPEQELYQAIRRYNNMYGHLGELTFYRQNFYKTRYVLGFGRTEDIPYGINTSITSGYVKQLFISRPYAALKFDYGKVSAHGNFIQFKTQAGGYYRNNSLEDVVLQGGIAYFTKLWQANNNYKFRNLVTLTYTQLSNQRVLDYLNISKKEIPGFSSDSIAANKRLALHGETFAYTPWSLLGFRFAPFVAVDLVSIECLTCEQANKTYWGLSTGFRTRNENLIFGTIEVKMTYIPEEENGEPKFVFGFKQNLRVRNTGTFVKKPSLIQYNN
jgi:hypothetical protein